MASGVGAAPPRPAPSPALHRACLASSPQPRGQQRRSPRGLPGARTPLHPRPRRAGISARSPSTPGPLPAWTPDRAVDPPTPPQQPTLVPSAPSATPEAQHSQGGPGHDLCSQPPGRAARPGPRSSGRPFPQAGRRLPAGAPRPVPQPPPALGGEGAAARRGVGVGAPPPPPARTPRPTAGRAGAAAPRGSLRPARSLDYSPLRRASGRAPPAEAVAASQGPQAARLRVFSLHSPNTQEITERQVTARSQ